MTTLWILNLCLIALDIALRFWWPQALPFIAFDPDAAVPFSTVIIFGASALLFSIALWLAQPLLNGVSRSAWKGWDIDRALDEADQTPLPFGLGSINLFARRKSAGMAIGGRDTTAAVAFSLVLIIVAIIGLAAKINHEVEGVSSLWVIFAAAAFILAAVSLGYAVTAIGQKEDGNSHVPAWLPAAVAILAAPFILCLLGVADGILASLSIHADQYPPAGFEAITYIVVRSVFLGICTFCLVFAPKKLVELAMQKESANKFFFSILIVSYAVWLTADWLFKIYR